MDFHQCAEPGCAFHLPTTYPFDKCPWHLAPGRSPKEKALIIGGAAVVFAIGWGMAKVWETVSATRRKEQVKQGQDEWRRMSEARRQARQDPDDNENTNQTESSSDQPKRTGSDI